jgi:hypothetical protein
VPFRVIACRRLGKNLAGAVIVRPSVGFARQATPTMKKRDAPPERHEARGLEVTLWLIDIDDVNSLSNQRVSL